MADKVRWIVIKSYNGSNFINDNRRILKEIRDRELFKYIEREQERLSIENKHCIDFSNEKEKDFICKILEAHKQSVIESFFYNSLIKDKKFFELGFLEYYMFSLQGFLKKKLLKSDNFNDIVLYNHLRSDGCYRIYDLTDYGFIYTKLYYLATFFCASNENTKHLINNHKLTLNSIKENLEKGKIKLYTYRP